MYKILVVFSLLFASLVWIYFSQFQSDSKLADTFKSKPLAQNIVAEIVDESASQISKAQLVIPALVEVAKPAAAKSIGWEEAGCVERLVYLSSGESMMAWDCPSKEVKHPYRAYPTASLEALAYSDAKAAEILGKRLAETAPDASLEWMLRASALNKGDYEPILYLVNTTYSAVDINGEFPAETVAEKYVLAGVISRLGGSKFPLIRSRDLLLEHGFKVSDLKEFDQVAKVLFDRIAAISLEITGEEILQEDDHV
jgi:hypothetical protein